MRIGIDAKWYFSGPPSGQRVIRGLVDAIPRHLSTDDEVHLFLDARAGDARPKGYAADRCHSVWGRVNQLSNIAVVPRVADRLRLDAVVYQNFAPPARLVRHRTIAFVHDVIFAEHPEYFTRAERLYFAPLRYFSRRATRVCTVSHSERARMLRLGFAAGERIDVVPNAVDVTFCPRSELPPGFVESLLQRLGVREPFVLYVGRLTARKNVRALLEALPHVHASGMQLVIVGVPDRTAADLPETTARLGLHDRVIFLGARGDESLPALYAAAAMFCFPSFDEGFGLPPLEAMASGTPVIASEIAPITETCGDAACYFDPCSSRSIATCIDAVTADSALRERLIQAGIERARGFTVDRSVQRLLESVRTAVAAA